MIFAVLGVHGSPFGFSDVSEVACCVPCCVGAPNVLNVIITVLCFQLHVNW